MYDLSCQCDDLYDYWYRCKDKFIPATKKGNCKSCRDEFLENDLILPFITWQVDDDGDEMNENIVYFCENCGEIFWNLDDLGFCINLESNMKELLQQYKAGEF